MKLTPKQAESFIRENTGLIAPPHVPEIALHLADEVHDLWQRSEEELEEIGLPPPFWAFAWAGGQGLARHIIDNPELVAGKRVLDFASGSGLVAIAAAKAGAAHVLAADIDPFCGAAIAMNARQNGVKITFTEENLVGEHRGDHGGRDDRQNDGWDVLLAGDVFYDKAFAALLLPWFETLFARGTEILVGDPGRAYLPKTGMQLLATYQVPVTRVLEDSEVKKTTVWRFMPNLNSTP